MQRNNLKLYASHVSPSPSSTPKSKKAKIFAIVILGMGPFLATKDGLSFKSSVLFLPFAFPEITTQRNFRGFTADMGWRW
jgi:hypothetical protein